MHLLYKMHPDFERSQLKFSKTISLAWTCNRRRTPSFDLWMLWGSTVENFDNVWSRSTGTHMVQAAPSGLRFWLTVDYRTNDTLSISAVCETYCINTFCVALWLNCNHISFNKSKNMTRSPQIPRWAVPFCLLSQYPYCQITKYFAMLHDKNCGIKWHFDKITWVRDKFAHIKLYISNMTHVATCFVTISQEFWQLIVQSNPDHVVVENWHIMYFVVDFT